MVCADCCTKRSFNRRTVYKHTCVPCIWNLTTSLAGSTWAVCMRRLPSLCKAILILLLSLFLSTFSYEISATFPLPIFPLPIFPLPNLPFTQPSLYPIIPLPNCSFTQLSIYPIIPLPNFSLLTLSQSLSTST